MGYIYLRKNGKKMFYCRMLAESDNALYTVLTLAKKEGVKTLEIAFQKR